jgi:hypothetical protein
VFDHDSKFGAEVEAFLKKQHIESRSDRVSRSPGKTASASDGSRAYADSGSLSRQASLVLPASVGPEQGAQLWVLCYQFGGESKSGLNRR